VNRRDVRPTAAKACGGGGARALGSSARAPDQGLLDAASEKPCTAGVSRSTSRSFPSSSEESAEVCVAAHGRWRDCTSEQRALLRGCSLDLIGLTVDQVLRLDRKLCEYRQSEADVKGAG